MEALLTKQKWSYKDYVFFDDEKRCEIIEGEIFMSPSASASHQEISRDLEFLMWLFVKAKNSGKVFNAPFDVILDENNVVQPDLLFISNKNLNLISERGVFGSPDLVVEIVSPSSGYRDKVTKKKLYEKFGVAEFLVVEPQNKSVEVFCLEGKTYELFSSAKENGEVKSKVIDGFSVTISEIFVA